MKEQVEEMFEACISKSEIARRLCIGRTSVRRMLEYETVSEPPVPESDEQRSQDG